MYFVDENKSHIAYPIPVVISPHNDFTVGFPAVTPVEVSMRSVVIKIKKNIINIG